MSILPFGFRGTVLPSVTWAGTRFHAVVDPDLKEIIRREEVGLGAVLDVQLLQAISTLPQGIEISWDAIDPVAKALLDCAPDGVLQKTSTGVEADLQPPLRFVGAFTVSNHWRALERLGIITAAAPSGVVVRHYPRRKEEAIARAAKFGVGLAVLQRDEQSLLVHPQSRTRPSVVRTLLMEVLYRLWRQRTGIPNTSAQASSCLGGASGR